MRPSVKRERPATARRAAQAADTRRRVLQAAHQLFGRLGYPRTTIVMIARAAGVAPETVYKAFGTKQRVLQELIDRSVAGTAIPPPLGVTGSDAFRAIAQEPDQRRRLARLAHLTRTILERAGPVHAIIRTAAATDSDIAALRRRHQRDRLLGQREFVRLLAQAGPLRNGLTLDDAAYEYWIMATPEIHHILVSEQGWSNDRYEAWLRRSLEALLLPAVRRRH
jgi:AcrR family transcriptional regulator